MGCTSYNPIDYESNQKEDYLTKTIFESIMARKRAKIQDAFDAERKEQEDREKELMRQQYLLDSINPRGPKSYVDNLINKEIPKMEFGILASEEAIVNDLNDRECEEYGEGEKEEEEEVEMTEGEIKEQQEKNKNEMEELRRQLEEMNKKSEEEKNKTNKNKRKKIDKDGFFGNQKENKENEEEKKDVNKNEEEEEENEEEKEGKKKENKKNKKSKNNQGEEEKSNEEGEGEEEEDESGNKQKGKKDKNKKKNNIQKLSGNEEEEEEDDENEENENKKNKKKNQIKKEKAKKSKTNKDNMNKNQEEIELEEENEIMNEESEDIESEEKKKNQKKKMQEQKRIKRQMKMKELMKLKAEKPPYIEKIKKYKYPKKEIEEKQKADFSPTPPEIIICVIGESKNGKTSFIKKYTRNVFEEIYKKTENIDTYDEAEAEYDSKKIKLTIIDTPPLNDRKNTNIIQENRINKSHIILYIVDINDEYADFKVKLTMQNFEFDEKQIIAIIGNKSDKVSIFSKKNKATLGILCSVRKYILEIMSCQDTPKNEIENFINEKIIKEYFKLYSK